MHILKMARPFIVDMHAHTHTWDVCYWADLLFSIFPEWNRFGHWGYLGAAEFTVAFSSVLVWHQRA